MRDDHRLLLLLERKLRRLSIPRAKANANPAVSEATARATDRDSIGQKPKFEHRIGADQLRQIKADSARALTQRHAETFMHHPTCKRSPASVGYSHFMCRFGVVECSSGN